MYEQQQMQAELTDATAVNTQQKEKANQLFVALTRVQLESDEASALGAELRAFSKDQRKRLASMAGQLEAAQGTNEELTSRLAATDERARKADAHRADVQVRFDKARGDLDTHLARSAQTSGSRVDAESTLRDQLGDAVLAREQLAAEAEERSLTLTRLQTELDAAVLERDEQAAARWDAQARAGDSLEKLQAIESVQAALEAELSTMQAKLNIADDRVYTLESLQDDLRQRLSDQVGLVAVVEAEKEDLVTQSRLSRESLAELRLRASPSPKLSYAQAADVGTAGTQRPETPSGKDDAGACA